jgi:hypothetical protein
LAGAATGEMEVVQGQVHRHQLPLMEDTCQFCEAAKWKYETANSCCRSGKVVLGSLQDLSPDFKQLFKRLLF